ncbi:MAG: pseudaminic acid cytidylyltransferase [Kiritimatiellia bacterium]
MQTENKAIAIIPARGGSKRIPRKNIRDFCGKPMIIYSIETALKSNLFSDVIVSTDDQEIADIAQKAGAEIPFLRPISLSDDFTGTDAVLMHALTNHPGPLPRYACCIYATAPFVTPEDLRKGLQLLIKHDATTAISVTHFPYCIHRALTVNPIGKLQMIWPHNYAKRSQDFPEAMHDAGQFYWMKTKGYLQQKKMFNTNSIPVPLHRKQVQDIDTVEDWEFAEILYKAQHTCDTGAAEHRYE